MELKEKINNRFNVFGTLLISMLLPCFLATLFLGVVFFPLMKQTATENDEARAQLILDTSSNHFEGLKENIGELVAAVESSSWIHTLYLDSLKGEMPGSATRKTIANDLNKACVRTGAKSLSFKFYDSPILYNNRGVVEDQEKYRNTYRENIQYLFYQADTQEEKFSTITFYGVEYLLYQCPFRDINGGRYKGEINILFQSDVIGSRMTKSENDSIFACFLTDAVGNRLWEYSTGVHSEKTETLSKSLQNGKFLFCVDVSDSVLHKTRNYVMPAIVTTMIVTLVISIILSYIISRAAYRPVQKIVWKFVGKDIETNNDLTALEQVFDLILYEKNKADSTLGRLRPIARQKILGALLDGTAFLGDSADSQMEQCQIGFPYPRLNVIALEAPFSQLEQNDMELAAELAVEAMLEQLANQLTLKHYLYYIDSDHYQIILNYQSWDDLQDYISLLTAQCRQFFKEHSFGERIYIGVGQAVFFREEIYRAAEQADTAINVAMLNRLEQPMFFSEVSPELNYEYYYPLSEELLISRAIANCNTETAREILHGVIDENRSRSKLDPKCLRLLYMDLCSTVTRSGQSLGISLNLPNVREKSISLDEIEERVGGLIESICEQILSRRQKTMNTAELQIMQYIDDHICDPNLSLNSLGDMFGKSPAYISLLFKEQRDVHYNTYVNKARIMRAVQLMDEQKLDSNTVYPMVGYVSLSTFRRNFAKYAKSNPGPVPKEL